LHRRRDDHGHEHNHQQRGEERDPPLTAGVRAVPPGSSRPPGPATPEKSVRLLHANHPRFLVQVAGSYTGGETVRIRRGLVLAKSGPSAASPVGSANPLPSCELESRNSLPIPASGQGWAPGGGQITGDAGQPDRVDLPETRSTGSAHDSNNLPQKRLARWSRGGMRNAQGYGGAGWARCRRRVV
jgi:hypothetical protein